MGIAPVLALGSNASRLAWIPYDERGHCLQPDIPAYSLKEGDWVRVFKGGHYYGDIGVVSETTPSRDKFGGIVQVLLVPRIRISGDRTSRPSQALFDDDKIKDFYGSHSVRNRNALRQFRSRWYNHGFLQFELTSDLLTPERHPHLADISLFADSVYPIVHTAYDRVRRQQRVRRNDRVLVKSGELQGVVGHIVDIDALEIVTVRPVDNEQEVDIPMDDIERFFKVGDHVKILDGQHSEVMGFVVSIRDNIAEVYDVRHLGKLEEYSADVGTYSP